MSASSRRRLVNADPPGAPLTLTEPPLTEMPVRPHSTLASLPRIFGVAATRRCEV